MLFRSGNDTEIIVGYEAGCLGFKLKRDLEEKGLTVKILAPASITGTEINRRRRKKTDKRDAEAIARSLKNHEYSEVYTPDEEDESVRDFIRMQQDHKKQLRVIKQQICAFTTRHGYKFTDGRNYWTKKHLKWLKELPLEGINKETLDSYQIGRASCRERV